MPTIIALKDFRLNAQRYIDALSRGQSFLVVKRSRPVFRLEPVEEQWETVADFRGINRRGVKALDLLAAIDSKSSPKNQL